MFGISIFFFVFFYFIFNIFFLDFFFEIYIRMKESEGVIGSFV